MKITLGIAACAMLALGASALAEPSAKPLYKRTGEICSTDEASGKVKEKYAGRSWRVMCRTEQDWELSQAIKDEESRYQARWLQRSQSERDHIPPPLSRSGPKWPPR